MFDSKSPCIASRKFEGQQGMAFTMADVMVIALPNNLYVRYIRALDSWVEVGAHPDVCQMHIKRVQAALAKPDEPEVYVHALPVYKVTELTPEQAADAGWPIADDLPALDFSM